MIVAKWLAAISGVAVVVLFAWLVAASFSPEGRVDHCAANGGESVRMAGKYTVCHYPKDDQ